MKICQRLEAGTTNHCYSDGAYGFCIRDEIARRLHNAGALQDIPL